MSFRKLAGEETRPGACTRRCRRLSRAPAASRARARADICTRGTIHASVSIARRRRHHLPRDGSNHVGGTRERPPIEDSSPKLPSKRACATRARR